MTSILIVLFAYATFRSVAESPPPNTNTIQWGEIVNGLQMHASVDPTNRVVNCWMRNGVTYEISYNEHYLGFLGFVAIEVRAGTNWVRLSINPSVSELIGVDGDGVGPSNFDVHWLAPREIAPNPRQVGGRWGAHPPREAALDSLRITTNGIRILSLFPIPNPIERPLLEPTFDVPICFFEWPAESLQCQTLECRAAQTLATAQGDYRRGWKAMTIHSQTFKLDIAWLRSLLESSRSSGR